MARPRRLERHSPVKLAIRVTDGLLGATEVEVRLARLADRPTAVTLLEIEECLGIFGFGWLLEFLGHVSPARTSSAISMAAQLVAAYSDRWEETAVVASPAWGRAFVCDSIAARDREERTEAERAKEEWSTKGSGPDLARTEAGSSG